MLTLRIPVFRGLTVYRRQGLAVMCDAICDESGRWDWGEGGTMMWVIMSGNHSGRFVVSGACLFMLFVTPDNHSIRRLIDTLLTLERQNLGDSSDSRRSCLSKK